MKLLIISASNNHSPGLQPPASTRLAYQVAQAFTIRNPATQPEIIELKTQPTLRPCDNCMACLDTKRCRLDEAFNTLYGQTAAADILFLICPHYAPIPARLCMILEKMEQITSLHAQRDATYRSELYGIPTGIISHGAGSEPWALRDYRKTVNDPIADALTSIQLKLVPLDAIWRTGISVPPPDEYPHPAIDEYVAKFMPYM